MKVRQKLENVGRLDDVENDLRVTKLGRTKENARNTEE
jgi:hypothetical protein